MAAKVSIIVPVYNAEQYLDECLTSIIHQTLSDIEIIVVDDGSKDRSADIMRRFAEQYDNMKVIHQEHAGVVEARITGYLNATGDYIGWVDADDFCDLSMFEILYCAAKDEDADVVSCNYNFYPCAIKNKVTWFKEYKGVVDWQFIERNTIQCNKIVKRHLMEELDIVKLFRMVGEGCYENVLIKAKKIITIDKRLYNYRVGHMSTSTNRSNYEWYLKHIEKNVNQLNIIMTSDYDPKYYDYFRYRLYYAILLALIVLAYNNKKSLYNQYVKQLGQYNVKKNRLNKTVLDYNYGVIKSVFIRWVVPHSFMLTRIAAKVML